MDALTYFLMLHEQSHATGGKAKRVLADPTPEQWRPVLPGHNSLAWCQWSRQTLHWWPWWYPLVARRVSSGGHRKFPPAGNKSGVVLLSANQFWVSRFGRTRASFIRHESPDVTTTTA